MSSHLAPKPWIEPFSPDHRPPFDRYHSSNTLPATPRTPFERSASSSNPAQIHYSTTRLRPYLTLPARLFLLFLTPGVLPLILTICHLFQNRSSTASLADNLRSSLLSACDGIARGAASLQSMPRYLALQTNQEVVRAAQASILGVGLMLVYSVTIIETVVTFMVDTYRSMLLCTIELAVRGSLELLIGTVKTISDGITSSLNSIRTNIQNDISSANAVIQSAADKINSVTSKLNININVPQFSVPSLDAIQNVQVPTTFEDSLIKLNSSLPSLVELKQKLDDIISVPFEALKNEINETRIEIAASFNASALPVPSLRQLSADGTASLREQLCGDLDTSLIDETANALHKLSTVAIGLMFLFLVLIWALLFFWEWRKWTALKDTVETLEYEWQRDKRDPWRAVAIVEHPMLERYGGRVFDRFRTGRTAETNLRWYLAWLAHPTCLALLLVSLFGFLTIQFQLLALDAIKSHARDNANSTVAASTQSLASKLNSYALESSQEYADNFNTAILAHQDRINNELFGAWLNTTAVTLNSTLVEFYSDVENVLNVTFGGTIIYGPINTFMYCILGSKITNLEKGLTWISEHAYITLPTLPPDVLLLSNSSMNEMAQPIAAAAVGSGGDGSDQGLVGSLIQHFETALIYERNFYAILLGLWLGFVLVGLVVVLWNCGARESYHEATSGISWWPNGRSPSNTPRAAHTVPRIVEPREEKSFFHPDRPSAPSRSATSRLCSLVAPGQAFLSLSRWNSTDHVQLPSNKTANMVHTPFEKNAHDKPADGDQEDFTNPPQFWLSKWNRARQSAMSFLPSRGQRHGEAIARAAATRNPAFSPSHHPNHSGQTDEYGESASWSMLDSPTRGRALDGVEGDGGRYPVIRSLTRPTDSDHMTYPRRLSRAPTVQGGDLAPFDRDPLPPVPKHDSIDYLDSDDEDEEERFNDRSPLRESYPSYMYSLDHDDKRQEFLSPGSSSVASLPNDAQVESVSKVHTGTAALASIIESMKEKQRGDPFRTPFDDPMRGGRI
ncbi:hypothetical protein BD324DRAFT_598625 [Kockovaella imperatae]|uniref:Plasma membrane fusion protein PRM1 n=1 Tax=Kockovaella imperatae TaxID=4999 RepID=A0A1Y1UMJ1_9TREE|nr:hypothetical protein BD324DRAFT_598625 [Kockovaella imperatae]ORX39271.1 hypothetical protein BD324DRAFT_598625 [Kockovaella imperatae]